MNRLFTYATIFRNSVRERLAYRAGAWLQVLSGIFFIFIQGSLWTALIQTGYSDVGLKEMISFVVINSLAANLTRFGAARVLGGRVRDGSIAIDMILPVSFKWKLFCELLGGNVFATLFAGIPGVAAALLVYGAAAPVSLVSFLFFLFSILLGVVLSFQIHYLFNLTAFWIVDPWYIEFLTSGLGKLFGGSVIPLWFYPVWLSGVSMYLPFRFCTYEPIQIYLGRLTVSEAWGCILMQLLWVGALLLLEAIIWRRASQKVFVQGG